VLQLLEECGVNHGKSQPDAALATKPDDAGLGLKNSFAFGE